MELSKRQILFKLWPFFGYKLLRGATFITSITFFIYFNEKGISYFQTSTLLSVLFFLPVFFEIITGGVADTFGRKFSVLIGIAGELIVLLGIVFVSNYLLLLALFALLGVVSTFTSGADDAWAIELISEDLRDKFLDHYYSLSASCFSVGMIGAGLLSSLLIIFYGNSSVWLARLIFVSIIFLVLLFTHENFHREKHEELKLKTFFENIRKGFYHFWNNLNTRNLISGEFFASMALIGIGSIAMQKYLVQSSLSEKNWGFVYSVSAIVGVATPLVASYVSRKFVNQKYYLIIVFLFQLSLFLTASIILNPFFAVILIFLHNTLEDAFNPVNSSFFQKEIPSDIRAILGSFQATTMGLSALFGTLVGGFLTNGLGGQMAIGILSLLFVPAIMFYFKIKTPISLTK